MKGGKSLEKNDGENLERALSQPCIQPNNVTYTTTINGHQLVNNPNLRKLPPYAQWKEGLRIFGRSKEPPVILVDMDNTLTDWERNFETLMSKHHPTVPMVPQSERTQFKIELNYDHQYRAQILHLTALNEFWLAMNPMQGAIQAVNEMVELGLVVFIVSTPDETHTARSALEKIAWIEKNLGTAWKYRAILTHDKTLIKGDILIDDKPGASVGVLQPSWSHLLYTQPYNKDLECPRLTSWSEWGVAIYKILVQRETQTLLAKNEALQQTLNCLRNSVRHQLHNNISSPARVFTASPRDTRVKPSTSRVCCEKHPPLSSSRQSMKTDSNSFEPGHNESGGQTEALEL